MGDGNTNDDAGAQPDTGNQPQPEPDNTPASDSPPQDQLGDAGKRALDEERQARKAAEKDLKQLRTKLQEFEDRDKSELDKATSRAEQAEQRASETERRAVRAEVRALAAGTWADPTDAPRYLDDLTQFVSDDGDVDQDGITKALNEVLEAKPHLAKADGGPRPPRPDAGQGARPNGSPSVSQQIAEAEQQGDWQKAQRLKLSQLRELSAS